MGEHEKDFGGTKSIGMFAGIALLINNITGHVEYIFILFLPHHFFPFTL